MRPKKNPRKRKPVATTPAQPTLNAPALTPPSFGGGLGGAGLALPSTLGAATLPAEDFIIAVVNQELVTNSELRARVARIEQDAARGGQALPAREVVVAQVLDALIGERAQLVAARDSGVKISDAEIDRAVRGVAQQNQITVTQLAQQLRKEGLDMTRLRGTLRDQLLLERVRDRELQARVRITDAEVDDAIAQELQARASRVRLNIAHLMVPVPEAAPSASEVAAAEQRALALLARAQAGEPFDALVREHSAANKDNGGSLGLREAERLPDPFVSAVRELKAGQVAPQLVRSAAGFHILKLVDKQVGEGALSVTESRARHILLRTDAGTSAEAATQKLQAWRRQIVGGEAGFAQLAREHSQDGSAPKGGDLGWVTPGMFVPEFETVMNALKPGEISQPVVSRFGVHLIQLMERKQTAMTPEQQREAARTALRASKSEQAYQDWLQEVRGRAFIEQRQAPQL
jgi:peptidyl-prolyl cis-trans isomerase SurA